MKFPSLETVRLLKPRLGFGSPEVFREDAGTEVDVGGPAHPEQIQELLPEEPQISLARLSEQLVMELAPRAEAVVVDSKPDLETAFVPEPEFVMPEASPAIIRGSAGSLNGCKVGAIGFGRQDFAGLASAMIAERARIEFLPHGNFGERGEFDLFFVNCASLEVLKRGAPSLKSILSSGTPAIMIGSRAVLNVLTEIGDPGTWDFAAKPLHFSELTWRALNLLLRREEAGIPKTLPRRVVVADHDPFSRTLIESALTSQGFACELVEDGEAAWTAIEKSEPGAVILDLTLPNRDGFQLMADIRRSTGRKPKVVVLSARQSEADILRAFALGADDYLTKPFSPLELHARLSRLLGGTPENV